MLDPVLQDPIENFIDEEAASLSMGNSLSFDNGSPKEVIKLHTSNTGVGHKLPVAPLRTNLSTPDGNGNPKRAVDRKVTISQTGRAAV